jgi:hypothetical protein
VARLDPSKGSLAGKLKRASWNDDFMLDRPGRSSVTRSPWSHRRRRDANLGVDRRRRANCAVIALELVGWVLLRLDRIVSRTGTGRLLPRQCLPGIPGIGDPTGGRRLRHGDDRTVMRADDGGHRARPPTTHAATSHDCLSHLPAEEERGRGRGSSCDRLCRRFHARTTPAVGTTPAGQPGGLPL